MRSLQGGQGLRLALFHTPRRCHGAALSLRGRRQVWADVSSVLKPNPRDLGATPRIEPPFPGKSENFQDLTFTELSLCFLRRGSYPRAGGRRKPASGTPVTLKARPVARAAGAAISCEKTRPPDQSHRTELVNEVKLRV